MKRFENRKKLRVCECIIKYFVKSFNFEWKFLIFTSLLHAYIKGAY